jgi:hypothetical protein
MQHDVFTRCSWLVASIFKLAAVAQSVERVLGKDEVLGSNPSGSFRVREVQTWAVVGH